jgi:hypothetical protein
MNFNSGDRVVCVDSSMQLEAVEELKRTVPNWVKKEEKYTIREIKTNRGIATGVLLEEIDNPIVFIKLIGSFQEPAFAEWRFRKLNSNEDMVEVNQEVLEMV